FASNNIIK
ncbi:hypothetical protein Tsp_08995, partial [Trichinella spiralis]